MVTYDIPSIFLAIIITQLLLNQTIDKNKSFIQSL